LAGGLPITQQLSLVEDARSGRANDPKHPAEQAQQSERQNAQQRHGVGARGEGEGEEFEGLGQAEIALEELELDAFDQRHAVVLPARQREGPQHRAEKRRHKEEGHEGS